VATLTVRLPRDLLNCAKRKALAERRTLMSLIEEGFRLVVSDGRKQEKSKRILPRLSRASGPPLPGVDVANSAALQETDDLDDDLDYVERVKPGFK
jgi:hypothetical protein